MRKAFSLIELLIVIVIIGVVYTLAVGNFQKIGEASTKVKLENLKGYLQKFPHAEKVKLLCLNDCSKCTVIADGEVQATLDDFLDASVKVYDYNFFLGVSKHPQEIYFNKDSVEEKICFSYSVDRKGVGEQVLVEFGGAVYDFSTYLTPVGVYKSLQEAMNAKEKLSQEVLR